MPDFLMAGIVDAVLAPEKLADTQKQLQKYRERLRNKNPQEITALYEQEKKKAEEDIRKIREANLPFFEKSTAKADYEFWSKATYWTLEEAVALSFGKEPEIVNSENLKYETALFAKEYRKLKDLTQRAYTFQKLYDPVLPNIYIGWTRQHDIPFPEELEVLVAKRSGNVTDWQKEYERLNELNTKSVNTANARFAEYEATIEKLEAALQSQHEELTSLREQENDKEGDYCDHYISPYMQLMRDAVIANHIDADNPRKKESLVQWFKDNEPEGVTISDNLARAMATLIRSPEAARGGNTKWKK